MLQQSYLANHTFPLVEGIAALHLFPDDADPKEGNRATNSCQALPCDFGDRHFRHSPFDGSFSNSLARAHEASESHQLAVPGVRLWPHESTPGAGMPPLGD